MITFIIFVFFAVYTGISYMALTSMVDYGTPSKMLSLRWFLKFIISIAISMLLTLVLLVIMVP